MHTHTSRLILRNNKCGEYELDSMCDELLRSGHWPCILIIKDSVSYNLGEAGSLRQADSNLCERLFCIHFFPIYIVNLELT